MKRFLVFCFLSGFPCLLLAESSPIPLLLPPPEPSTPKVSIDSEEKLPLLGCILEPSTKVEVSSPVAGVLKNVPVKRGDSVQKGQVLFQLEAGVQSAAVDLAKVKAEFAERKQQRNQDLYTDDLLSPLEQDEIETEMRTAQQELKLKQEELALRTVRSPVAGVVTDRYNSEGEYVGVDPVMSLATLDPLHVDILMPADYFGVFQKGDTLTVHPHEPVGGAYPARISIIDPLIDPASGTFRIQLKLRNPGLQLPAGLRCTVSR